MTNFEKSIREIFDIFFLDLKIWRLGMIILIRNQIIIIFLLKFIFRFQIFELNFLKITLINLAIIIKIYDKKIGDAVM